MNKEICEDFLKYLNSLPNQKQFAIKRDFGRTLNDVKGKDSWLSFYQFWRIEDIPERKRNVYFFIAGLVLKNQVNIDDERNKISMPILIGKKYSKMSDSQKRKIDVLFRIKLDENGKFLRVLKSIIGNEIPKNLDISSLVYDLSNWNEYSSIQSRWAIDIFNGK